MFNEIGVQADSNVIMTDIGNNLHDTIDIDQYYGFPTGTNVAKLAFVFRNFDGTLEGKTATMGDIFYPIYPLMEVSKQLLSNLTLDILVDMNDNISFEAQSNSNANLQLF